MQKCKIQRLLSGVFSLGSALSQSFGKFISKDMVGQCNHVRKLCNVVIIFTTSLSAIQASGIENLKIQVIGGNAVLSWPSLETEKYRVQFRTTVDTNSTWQTLTNFMPAATGTNTTSFVHYDQVPAPVFSQSAASSELSSDQGITSQQENIPAEESLLDEVSNIMLPLFPPTFSELSQQAALESIPPLDSGDEIEGETSSFPAPTCGFYQVMRNGVTLIGLQTNCTVYGDVVVPIEICGENTNAITGITIFADGNPMVGASVQKNEAGIYMFDWNTSFIRNGTYQISAEVSYDDGDPLTNAPVSITIDNIVSFPLSVTHIFDDQMWLYAELCVLEADFDVDIYADGTNYIGTFSGYTTDGVISFIWNLQDPNGNTLTNSTFSGEFFIYPWYASNAPGEDCAYATSSSSSSGKATWAKEVKCPLTSRQFVVAWGALNTIPQTAMKQELVVAEGVNNILGDFGQGYPLAPSVNQPYNDRAFRLCDTNSAYELLMSLQEYNSRYFYFFGHGSASSFGGIEPCSHITQCVLNQALWNNPSSRMPTNCQPYRLVFLDSCESGKGRLCEEFGITPETLSFSYFHNAGVRSRAFLGYKKKISFNYAQWEYRADMLSKFWADWGDGRRLDYCVSNAVHHTFSPMDSSWVIYGAPDMTKDTK